jgi:hypothetical protein
MKRSILLLLAIAFVVLSFLWCTSKPLSGVVQAQNGTIVVHLTTSASYQFHVLRHPTGIVSAARINACAGNGYDLYFSDTDNNVMREFSPGGTTLNTVAGSGVAGFADGVGTAAQFNQPTGIVGTATTWFQPPRGCAFATSVTFAINDASNFRVRQMKLTNPFNSGTVNVTTLYGSGTNGYVNGSPLSAQFSQGGGVISGAMIADTANHVIRQATSNGVTTLAGSGSPGLWNAQGASAEFAFPTKIVSGAPGNYYVSDTGNNAIRKIDGASNVTSIAGGGDPGYVDGPGSSAKFNWPTGTAYCSNVLYVADTGNNVIRKIDLLSGSVSTYAGLGPGSGLVDGPLLQAKFHTPTDIVVPVCGGQYMYVTDTMNNAVRRIDMTAGQVTTYIN